MAVTENANAGQLAAWDGSAGEYWTDHEARFDDAVRAYNGRLFAAAAVAPGDRVLDVGCGTGWTTREAARLAWTGSAVGVDVSSRMLERARRRTEVERIPNARYLQVDAQVHEFEEAAFDVVISRTGAMFFADPIAAFTNLHRALAPGGRLALLTWQAFAANEWIVAVNEALAVGRPVAPPPPDAPSPFALADPARVDAILTASGFAEIRLEPVDAPFFLGDDADDAFDFTAGFTASMVEELDADGRALAHRRLRETMAAHDTGLGVVFGSSAWVVSAHAG